MKRTKIPFLLVASAAIVGLASCNIYDLFFDESSSMEKSGSNGVSHDSSWQPSDDLIPHSLKKISNTIGADYLPSTGDVRLLVLPIEFTDCPFTQQTLTDLNTVCNGTAEETGYWESLSSFYKKSSFGKSRLSFEIAPTYKTGMTQQQAWNSGVKHTSAGYESDNGSSFVINGTKNYIAKQGSGSTKKFDSDGNGWIDGVIAVYSGHNYSQMGTATYDKDVNYYWAYTYWASEEANVTNPSTNLYFWMSYDFMYNAVNSPKVDAHTMIHETGHMYGLDDYYPYNSKKNLAGCWDMMDENILDHNVYSKMMLGWVNPIVVTEPKELSINPSSSSGECILIPTDSWNGTGYDEYMLLELYTPTDLNALDSQTAYPGRYKGYTKAGVKLYHVDSRLIEIRQDRYGSQDSSYVTNPTTGIHWQNTSTYAYGYVIGASNAQKYTYVDSNFALLHMIEADNVFDFNTGGYGENKDLFATGYSFDLQNYKKFFVGRNSSGTSATMNNGSNFSYKITFSEVASDHATISFTKK